MIRREIIILDPFLQKVERLPDEILHYIHSYIDIETKIEIICCGVFPVGECLGINMIQMRLNLLNFYEVNHSYKLPVNGKMTSILDILLEIRHCDLLQFYHHFKCICSPRTILPRSTCISIMKGDGGLSYIPHPVTHMLLYADKTACNMFHSRYISDIIHRENLKPYFTVTDKVTFQDRYTISSFLKTNRSLYISDHLARIKEIMFLLLIFIRNFQNTKTFNSIIDNILRNRLHIFLRDFLNSELVCKAVIRMHHRQCMKSIRGV